MKAISSTQAPSGATISLKRLAALAVAGPFPGGTEGGSQAVLKEFDLLAGIPFLAVMPLEERLVIERVDVAGPARHEELHHALGLGRMMQPRQALRDRASERRCRPPGAGRRPTGWRAQSRPIRRRLPTGIAGGRWGRSLHARRVQASGIGAPRVSIDENKLVEVEQEAARFGQAERPREFAQFPRSRRPSAADRASARTAAATWPSGSVRAVPNRWAACSAIRTMKRLFNRASACRAVIDSSRFSTICEGSAQSSVCMNGSGCERTRKR